jgi:glycosyltransferase involved in cell wall biosynthesis
MTPVFIGIPTFNRADLVIQTIESVRRQSYTDYRVIVSDNGSDGHTIEKVRAFVEGLQDPRFSFHLQPRNDGEYGQGRFFLDASQGSHYLMILHDDDLLTPDYLRLAVAALNGRSHIALYVANPWLIDAAGDISAHQTRTYLEGHGRKRQAAGEFKVLDAHLAYGFTPISGTLFRRETLLKSGFVDPDAVGNFPFECDLFLRLGDIGATGWFSPAQLLRVRFHDGSLRNTLHLMHNPFVVRSMIRLFSERRYDGWRERRRKTLLSRLLRAEAMIQLREGDPRSARLSAGRACKINPLSINGWRARLQLSLIPGRVRKSLPPLAPQAMRSHSRAGSPFPPAAATSKQESFA